MPNHLSTTTCEALHRVLGGTYIVAVDDGVTAVFAPLPKGCPAAMTRVDGHVWIVVDLDKPLALRHARAMLNDYGASQGCVDLGDDDLNRDWQLHTSLLPLPRPAHDEPLPVTAQFGRWAAMAACVITGASAIVAQWGDALTGVVA